MRTIEVSAEKYAALMAKYLKEDYSDLFGVDVTDAPIDDEAMMNVLDGATDAVLADDIVDGAARRWSFPSADTAVMNITFDELVSPIGPEYYEENKQWIIL